MSNISITFKNNGKIARDPIELGTMQALTSTGAVDLKINHNSNQAIRNCGLFISPYKGYYSGTKDSELDYNKVLWFADNFPGYGLFVKQKLTVFGEVYTQDSRRLMDVTRTETRDIFTGFEIEMLSGFSNGEKRRISGYDIDNNMFNLDSDFSAALEGDRFKIEIEEEEVFKSKQGASEEFVIPLLHGAGKIDRFEEAEITLELKTPPFIKEAGRHLFDLNLKYTPEE